MDLEPREGPPSGLLLFSTQIQMNHICDDLSTISIAIVVRKHSSSDILNFKMPVYQVQVYNGETTEFYDVLNFDR